MTGPVAEPAAFTVAVVVVSGAVAAGAAPDAAGPLLAELAAGAGGEIVGVEVVEDDREAIAERLRAHVAARTGVVLTAGGSGLTPDDLTPEATRDVIEREAPGFAEALRARSLRHTPMGILSRAIAGTAGETFIINLPGSPKAISEVFDVIGPVLGHAVATLRSPGGSRHLHRSGRPSA